MVNIQLVDYKEKIKRYFDKQVYSRDFHEGNLILRKINGPRQEASERRMAAN